MAEGGVGQGCREAGEAASVAVQVQTPPEAEAIIS